MSTMREAFGWAATLRALRVREEVATYKQPRSNRYQTGKVYGAVFVLSAQTSNEASHKNFFSPRWCNAVQREPPGSCSFDYLVSVGLKTFSLELVSDVATKLKVFCLVHHTHALAPDLAEDAVMGNGLTNGLGGRRHLREC
jgi:hypothetical protein